MNRCQEPFRGAWRGLLCLIPKDKEVFQRNWLTG
jgi:hypothetical protein